MKGKKGERCRLGALKGFIVAVFATFLGFIMGFILSAYEISTLMALLIFAIGILLMGVLIGKCK